MEAGVELAEYCHVLYIMSSVVREEEEDDRERLSHRALDGAAWDRDVEMEVECPTAVSNGENMLL